MNRRNFLQAFIATPLALKMGIVSGNVPIEGEVRSKSAIDKTDKWMQSKYPFGEITIDTLLPVHQMNLFLVPINTDLEDEDTLNSYYIGMIYGKGGKLYSIPLPTSKFKIVVTNHNNIKQKLDYEGQLETWTYGTEDEGEGFNLVRKSCDIFKFKS